MTFVVVLVQLLLRTVSAVFYPLLAKNFLGKQERNKSERWIKSGEIKIFPYFGHYDYRDDDKWGKRERENLPEKNANELLIKLRVFGGGPRALRAGPKNIEVTSHFCRFMIHPCICIFLIVQRHGFFVCLLRIIFFQGHSKKSSMTKLWGTNKRLVTYIQLRTKHMALLGGATSKRLDSLISYWCAPPEVAMCFVHSSMCELCSCAHFYPWGSRCPDLLGFLFRSFKEWRAQFRPVKVHVFYCTMCIRVQNHEKHQPTNKSKSRCKQKHSHFPADIVRFSLAETSPDMPETKPFWKLFFIKKTHIPQFTSFIQQKMILIKISNVKINFSAELRTQYWL